jgi:predicted metal-dependent hydrolase
LSPGRIVSQSRGSYRVQVAAELILEAAVTARLRQMKTKWGGCTTEDASLRLDTELARKPPEFLEYVVVHEMSHLIEASHNVRFICLMDQHLPNWRHMRDELNRLPLRDVVWS